MSTTRTEGPDLMAALKVTSSREALGASADQTRDADAAAPALGQHIDLRRAAELLDVSPRTLYRLCTNGTLPHLRVGRAIRVAVRDLERLRVNPTTPTQPPPAGGLPAGHRPPPARAPRGRYARLARGLGE